MDAAPWSNINWLGLVGGLFKSCSMFEQEEHDTSSSSIIIDLLLDGWKKFNVFFVCFTYFGLKWNVASPYFEPYIKV